MKFPLKSLSLVFLTLLLSCAKKDPAIPPHAISEAYSLMDKGENTKAVLILENYLKQDPNNLEGKILLASGYLGVAGVDIYHSFQSFKDLLFNRSLSDQLWGDSNDSFPNEAPPQNGTPAEEFLSTVDDYILKFQELISFLNRFPVADQENWPLLTKALNTIEDPQDNRDVYLYRIFIRIVYLKSVLKNDLISNPSFGSRIWFCRLDLDKSGEQIDWFLTQFLKAGEDYKNVFPDAPADLWSFLQVLKFLKDDFYSGTPGSEISIELFQKRLRERLHCST